MDALNCTYDDYQKAAGFSELDNLVKERPRLGKFFKIENGGMRLPSIHSRILANPSLDRFVMDEFKKFAAPNSRLFWRKYLYDRRCRQQLPNWTPRALLRPNTAHEN